ncbi:MAG: hypothetical protein WBF38_01590 [Nitrosotalea sp.]
MYDQNETDQNRYYTYMVFLPSSPENHQDIPIKYRISHFNLEYITLDPASSTLYVHHQTNIGNEGQITLVLPRNIIDSKHSDGVDNSFVVSSGVSTASLELQDLEPQDFNETGNNAENRTITLLNPFLESRYHDVITIQGSQSIPEFGPISMILFAVAITGIITVSVISRQKFGL